MKIYFNLFLVPFILIIIFSLLSGFAPASDLEMVENLIRERTDILNRVYFNEIEAEKGEQLLYKIEAQPLLASDIKSLREFADTDMDRVRDINILVLEQTSGLYGYKSFRAELLWHIKGYGGNYTQSVNYNIVLKQSGSDYKLSEFTAIP